jgi:hypothetical protein
MERSRSHGDESEPGCSGSWERCPRVKATWLALPLRPLTPLAQEQEPRGTGGQARSGGGLGQREMAISELRIR